MLPELEGLDRPAKILGMFAHPDDEVFCGGGLFAEMSQRGAAVRIVSVTKGEAGQIRSGIARRQNLGEVRTAELQASAAVLGVIDVRTHDRGDGQLTGQRSDELIDIVRQEITEFDPDVVITFGPDGAYGHPDHITVSDVTTQAGLETGTPVYQAAFPQQGHHLLLLLSEWLVSRDERFRGTPEFASGLMLFADGSSMLGLAADHMVTVFYPPGTYIVEQGEAADELFLVLSGTASVQREGEFGAMTEIAKIGPGAFFGEAGVAQHQARNAHVVADTGVTCFVLSPKPPHVAKGRGTTSDVPNTTDTPADTVGAQITIDVRRHAAKKFAALSCHRSQYEISPDLCPETLIDALLGLEHFNRVP